MNYEQARDYMLNKPEAELDYPFGPDVGVPKVRGKMFATLGEEPVENSGGGNKTLARINLKCDPTEAQIERMIDSSYALVVKGLKKADRVALETKYGKDALYGPTSPKRKP